MKKFVFLFISILITVFPQSNNGKLLLKTGADVLVEQKLDMLKGKSIGIITNHTAILKTGVHLVDELVKEKSFKIIALFGPEHGIRGNAPAGEKVSDSIDVKTSIKTYSLYGKYNKPTPEMLKGIDLLIFDIQDVGARFYTYISTLYYLIECASENKIPLIVLDRPNPIGGLNVNGPVRDDSLKSFVGIAPVPVTHGMTVGELALYFNGEVLNGHKFAADLTVIKMEGWNRDKYYDDFYYPWLNPSPNINGLETALVYPGTCLLEGTNVAEGRGTEYPFLTIGAPYINKADFQNELRKFFEPGVVEFIPTEFTPVSIEGKSTNPKHKNVKCGGVIIKVLNREKFEPVKTGVIILSVLSKLYKNEFLFTSGFNRLAGSGELKEQIKSGMPYEKIEQSWQNKLNEFLITRKKYLLY